MSQHTPEPWDTEYRESNGSYRQEIFDIASEPIAYLTWFPVPTATGTATNREANARRIVACVNALQGVPTEQLEAAASLGITDVSQGNLFSSRMKLQQQRDELLAALEQLYSDYVGILEAGRDRIMDLGGHCDPVDVMERGDPRLIDARAAIAKAKGGSA